ncbi:MAG: hypothetical protein ABS54_07710 [Hyphomicrobium sp. SCN 65-11]|nr:MAG: hypothetical protein ABS54_07710 [Hyphomicrobium sp. SCN 65-11]
MNRKEAAGNRHAEKNAFRTALYRAPTPKIAAHGLAPLTRLVLLAVLDHVRDMSNGAWPSEKTLAKKTAMVRRSIGTHIRAAEKAGWLQREKRPKRRGQFGGNLYVLAIPPAARHEHEMPMASASDHGHLAPRPWANDGKDREHEMPTNSSTQRTLKGEPQRAPAREDGGAVGFRDKGASAIAVRLVAEHVGDDAAIRLADEFARWKPAEPHRDPDRVFLFNFVKKRNIHINRRALQAARIEHAQEKA